MNSERRKLTDAQQAQIIALAATGQPQAAIAREVGVSRRSVHSVVKASAIGELPQFNVLKTIELLNEK